MKIFEGEVIAKNKKKTATVKIGRIVIHPVYKKRYKRAKKYHVHDELGAKVGDKVVFVPSKPYSKLKKWRITEIVSEEKKRKKKSKKKRGKK